MHNPLVELHVLAEPGLATPGVLIWPSESVRGPVGVGCRVVERLTPVSRFGGDG
jgi:hypothetical protein